MQREKTQAEFAVAEEQRSFLTSLVIFHGVTLILVMWALWFRARGS